ncbi:expressed protein [Chlorella variabilis]|uniref:Expressed protein n=1 Tax=Chlorella variabilis TaxID=554065 RepID=E1ZGN9_CHLVA|nr:expressed protein [Chlorella variabilis]EFN54969.1 expressed protein [Chlorella variabilis]|eukprot:XP_005847071.1 expressed protein [Chlorella variabilis]
MSEHGAGVNTTAGFPVRAPRDVDVPGFTTVLGRGILSGALGADFECEGSLLPGKCTDGCSKPVSVLQSISLSDNNDFLAPIVYTLVQDSSQLQTFYLHPGEAEVVAPSDAELAVIDSDGLDTAELANSTIWLGCIIAPALMGGRRVQVLDGLESAEACCRECRMVLGEDESEGGGCNAFNFCPRELLFQEEVQPVVGWPPRVLAKGAEVPFLGGSPLSATFPEVPGHTRLLGRGMFAQAGFSCPGSLKPEIQECIL